MASNNLPTVEQYGNTVCFIRNEEIEDEHKFSELSDAEAAAQMLREAILVAAAETLKYVARLIKEQSCSENN